MDRRENCMKDIVFSALNLLIGVVQITWMIARDVFRGRPKATAKAKHYSKIITPRENAGFAERPHRGHNTSRA